MCLSDSLTVASTWTARKPLAFVSRRFLHFCVDGDRVTPARKPVSPREHDIETRRQTLTFWWKLMTRKLFALIFLTFPSLFVNFSSWQPWHFSTRFLCNHLLIIHTVGTLRSLHSNLNPLNCVLQFPIDVTKHLRPWFCKSRRPHLDFARVTSPTRRVFARRIGRAQRLGMRISHFSLPHKSALSQNTAPSFSPVLTPEPSRLSCTGVCLIWREVFSLVILFFYSTCHSLIEIFVSAVESSCWLRSCDWCAPCFSSRSAHSGFSSASHLAPPRLQKLHVPVASDPKHKLFSFSFESWRHRFWRVLLGNRLLPRVFDRISLTQTPALRSFKPFRSFFVV